MRGIQTLAIVALCAVAVGCGPAIKADRAAFDAGYAAFETRQWQLAVDHFTGYLRSDPTSVTRGEVYYYRGQAQLHLNRRAEAKADFERALGAEVRAPIDQFARVAIGNLYYEEGNDAKAIEHYAVVLADPNEELPMAMVLLRTSVSLQRVGRWSTADKYLAYLMEKHPGTPQAKEAARRIHADAFRVQTGAYAAAASAAAETRRLRAAGFTVRIAKTGSGGRVLHAVQVGSARNFAEADALARRVRAAGYATLIVP